MFRISRIYGVEGELAFSGLVVVELGLLQRNLASNNNVQ